MIDSLFKRGGKSQATTCGIINQHFIQAGFIDGRFALAQVFDTFSIYIHTNDVVTCLCEACPADESNITTTDY